MGRLFDIRSSKAGMADLKIEEGQGTEGFRVMSTKAVRGTHAGVGLCAECGGEVKVLVSRRRNPHSSKLGRAVSLKDHDLCRRCWRKLVQRQQSKGVMEISPLMLRKDRKLRPRLLTEINSSWPREAS